MNFKRKSIGIFTKVWLGVKLLYFEDDFYVYAYKYVEKRQKEKINFDELLKNSRIKIITIKIMRFKSKDLNFTL